MPPGGKIELAPLPSLDTALEGAILVPRDVAPKIPVPGGAEKKGKHHFNMYDANFTPKFFLRKRSQF